MNDSHDSEASSPMVGPRDGRPTTSLRHSFGHAWRGFAHAFHTQRNLRIHLAAALAVYAVGLGLKVSAFELAVLTLAMAIVVVTEVLNTVVEVVVDSFTDHYHPSAKIAKDVAAGAVLVAAILAVLVGILVFGRHLLAFVRRR